MPSVSQERTERDVVDEIDAAISASNGIPAPGQTVLA